VHTGTAGLIEVVELLADREGNIEGGDIREAAERPVDDVSSPLLALVEDNRSLGARRLGVLDLDDEVAGAALDQGHVAGGLGGEG
jgi:hypothetical protein